MQTQPHKAKEEGSETGHSAIVTRFISMVLFLSYMAVGLAWQTYRHIQVLCLRLREYAAVTLTYNHLEPNISTAKIPRTDEVSVT